MEVIIMFYFKVKCESDLYSKLNEAESMKNKWNDSRPQLYPGVDLPITDLLVMSATQLYYPEEPPVNLRNEFKKYREHDSFVAKANSPLNKKWINICMETGLTTVRDMGSILFDEMLVHSPYAISSKLKTIMRIDDDYYLEGKNELPKAEFLKQITESEYLEARLMFAKSNEADQSNG
jgi:hypothetical protein